MLVRGIINALILLIMSVGAGFFGYVLVYVGIRGNPPVPRKLFGRAADMPRLLFVLYFGAIGLLFAFLVQVATVQRPIVPAPVVVGTGLVFAVLLVGWVYALLHPRAIDGASGEPPQVQ